MMPVMCAKARSRAQFVTAAAWAIAAGLIVSPVSAQSLADVAKKEADRRKTVLEPAKVYTNKDLSPVPPGSPPPPATPAPDASAKTGDADKKGDDKGEKAEKSEKGEKEPVKDQAYWSGRLKALKDKLARDKDYADAMQTRINSLTTDFVNRDDPAQRSVIEQNRNKSIAELGRLNTSVKDTQKAIDDLLEEARRAGVPPGWLR
jgi:hypothetical protein